MLGLLAAGVTLLVDARYAGSAGAAYHVRPQLELWGASALLVPYLALALQMRIPAFVAAASVSLGGALSNGIALERWGGVPDYWTLPWPRILVSAGDVAIWLGLAGSVLAVAVYAAGHVRRGGSLHDPMPARQRGSDPASGV